MTKPSTEQGENTRERVYQTALELIADKGYEGTSLRKIAKAAGVSPALIYRYFPSKRAIVVAFYEGLAAEYVAQVRACQARSWRERFLFALHTTLEVLRPHRETLSALVPVLVGEDGGLLADPESFSRGEVLGAFVEMVNGAPDSPDAATAESLGRVLYFLHLGVVLWWLLDRSESQRATDRMLASIERSSVVFSLGARLPWTRRFIRGGDEILRLAFF